MIKILGKINLLVESSHAKCLKGEGQWIKAEANLDRTKDKNQTKDRNNQCMSQLIFWTALFDHNKQMGAGNLLTYSLNS